MSRHTHPPTNPDSDTLHNVGLIWDDSDDTQSREWFRLNRDFANAGYREGITTGKNAALQEGFDDGFARVGVHLGRELGLLRGATSAALSLVSSSAYRTRWSGETNRIERCKDEVISILGSLGRIHLVDVAPSTLSMEEHDQLKTMVAEAVLGDPNLSHSVESISKPLQDMSPATTPAVEELDRIRARISNILREIGLDHPLI